MIKRWLVFLVVLCAGLLLATAGLQHNVDLAGTLRVLSGASITAGSGATVDFTGATQIGFGGGATSTAALTDLAPTKSGSTLTLGASCSSSAPCRVYYGHKLFTFTAPITGTVSGTSASSTLYSWLDENGIQMGHAGAATLTCSGCTAQTGISGFPVGQGFQIGAFTYTNNAFDTITAAMDKRAFAGAPAIRAADSTVCVTYNPNGFTEVGCAYSRFYQYFPASSVIANNNVYGGGGWMALTANANTITWSPTGIRPYLKLDTPSSTSAWVILDLTMSPTWNGGSIRVDLDTIAISGNNTGSAAAVAEVAGVCIAGAGAWPDVGTPGFPTGTNITITHATASNTTNITTVAALATSGCTANTAQKLFIGVRRIGGDAGDTDAGSLNIMGAGVGYQH